MNRPYRVKPLEQIGGSCWFYSIMNIILHSRILRRNIEIAIKAKPKLEKCSTQCECNTYYNILHAVRGGRINLNTLRQTFTHLARTRNNLTMGANYQQRLRAFRIFLTKFGLPRDTISYKKRPGYRLVGKFITLKMLNKNNPNTFAHNYHNVTGVYNYFGKPVILDSAYKTKYNVDWRHSNEKLNRKLKRVWKNTPWGQSNINLKNVYITEKIYVRRVKPNEIR